MGYVKIDSFPAEYEADRAILSDFYRQCGDRPDLIFDLTDNSGGSEAYWEELLVAPPLMSPCPASTWPWSATAATTPLIWIRSFPPSVSSPEPAPQSASS